MFGLFAVDIHYHIILHYIVLYIILYYITLCINFCYLLYSNNLTGKSVKNYNDKKTKNTYLIIKALKKIIRKLSMRMIRMSETITKWIEAILAHANSLEKELLKSLKINLISPFCKNFYFVLLNLESMSV